MTNLKSTVRRCVPLPDKMHMVAGKAKTVEDLEEIISGLAVLINASEQPIYRGELHTELQMYVVCGQDI